MTPTHATPPPTAAGTSTHGVPAGEWRADGPLLTVVVPVYNTAATLERCLEPLRQSSYQALEVIMVDDGSTDNSGAMCDQWAARDSRFSVIHQANGGLSAARNAALDVCHGEYVTFVDSDDHISPSTLGDVMQVALAHSDYDMVEYGMERVGGGDVASIGFDDRAWHDMDRYWLDGRAYAHSYMWNKVFRRRLFDGVRFPVGVAFEDIHTLPLLLKRAKVVATTSRGTYFYYLNPQGITATAGGRQLSQLLDAHMKVIGHYWNKPGFDPYYLHVLNIQLAVCRMTGHAPRLPHRRVSVKCAPGITMKTKVTLLNILGIKLLCNTYKALTPRPRRRW